MKQKNKRSNEKGNQKNATERVANEELSWKKPCITEFTKIDGNTTLYYLHGTKANARIRVEKDADLVLKNINCKLFGQPHDEVLLATDRRFNHYKAHQDHISLRVGLFVRKYYRETVNFKCHQILIPKWLFAEVLWSLHREFEKDTGGTKAVIVYGEKFFIIWTWQSWSESG